MHRSTVFPLLALGLLAGTTSLAETVTLHPGPARLVPGSNFAADPVDQVTVPMMNVNVDTDRWTDQHNLIDCG